MSGYLVGLMRVHDEHEHDDEDELVGLFVCFMSHGSCEALLFMVHDC